MNQDHASAMVLRAPRELSQEDFAFPNIGSNDALLRVEACGLCGTDHEQFTGELFGDSAFVPGHETIGVIESIGSAASQLWGVAQGDRVAVEVFQSCRKCAECSVGNYRHCEVHGLASMYGFIPAEKDPGLWGGYATHQYLGPDAMVIPVPEALDPVVATLFNPIGAGIRWGVTVPDTRPGDVVAVLGPGIRGLSAAAAAKEAGAGFVMVTGYGERDAPRLAAARNFGADLVVDVASENPAKALAAAVGAGADVVVDVTAKAPTALAQGINIAKSGGTLVIAGTRGTTETPGFTPDLIVYKELRILGALGVDVQAYSAALDLLSSGKYPFAELQREVAGFDSISELLSTMSGESGRTPPIHGVFAPE